MTVFLLQSNEKSLLSELDHHVNTIMSSVRRQQEELKRSLKNDFEELKKPFIDELRRCNSMKTSMQELMKKVSDIKRTTDTGLRISVCTIFFLFLAIKQGLVFQILTQKYKSFVYSSPIRYRIYLAIRRGFYLSRMTTNNLISSM